MQTLIILSSDCCGSAMNAAYAYHGICPKCGEHCEIVEENVAEDNGEY